MSLPTAAAIRYGGVKTPSTNAAHGDIVSIFAIHLGVPRPVPWRALARCRSARTAIAAPKTMSRTAEAVDEEPDEVDTWPPTSTTITPMVASASAQPAW